MPIIVQLWIAVAVSFVLCNSLTAALALRRHLPPLSTTSEETKRSVEKCRKFLDACPEPFHVVKYVTAQLRAAGFTALDESSLWGQHSLLKRGGKYYFTRNASSVVAFAVGGQYVPGNGFKVIGAHTDSPNLRLKPKSKKTGSGCIQLNVECYGGGLWHTWFDRDLSLAGRVILKPLAATTATTTATAADVDSSSGGAFRTLLVKIDRPLLRIPNLCIHLQSGSEREAFKVNKQEHLMPILCGEVKKAFSNSKQQQVQEQSGNDDCDTDSTDSSESNTAETEATETTTTGAVTTTETVETSAAEKECDDLDDLWRSGQQPELLLLLSLELGCGVEDILDFELSLFDTQAAAVSGYREEFLCSSRLDNLASCFAAVEALEAHCSTTTTDTSSSDSSGSGSGSGLSEDGEVSIVALFDHEEVGSGSVAGAGSTLIGDAIERISFALSSGPNAYSPELHKAARARSFIMSVDMAHAVHPNYASKHDRSLSPSMNAGVVIKSNSNQRYATNGVSGFLVRELARRSNVPIQEFAVRNDCPCGSTIGPMLSTNTGIRAVDLGMPQLSMHSIREMMGCQDLHHGTRLFTAFFRDFKHIEAALKIDSYA